MQGMHLCTPRPELSSSHLATMAGSGWRQFAAVLHKNLLLQCRGRGSFLGVSGWGALLLQLLVPVAFVGLMWLPKYYISPYQHPAYLQSQAYDIDTKWWAGASPYEGPALAAGGNARVVLVPNTSAVAALATRLAMAVACPEEPYKRICSPGSITSFACLFGVSAVPPECRNSSTCMATPACYQPALERHLLLAGSEADVVELLQRQPHSLDAVVVFPQAVTAAANSSAGGSSSDAPAGDASLLEYVIRLNASDVPPTRLLRDLFDVSPGLMPLPGNLLWEYRRYWFFVNLQLALDRALLGGQQAAGTRPAPLSVRLKPFPWPAKQEDLGAASAAAFFNLLLVYAFLAPTRGVVGGLVREKELRLREGMRILGLSDGAYYASWALTHWATLAASGLLCALAGMYPFRYSSLAVMVAFFWLFAAALVAASYFLATLFATSRVAGTATQLIYALSMIPGFLLPLVRPYGGASWYAACLSPTSAASLFAAGLVNWERLAAGVTLRTLWLPITPDSSFCVGSVLWLLLLDVFLFGALTWYCDKVMPSPYGQVLPPWFFLQPSWWLSGRAGPAGSSSSSSASATPSEGGAEHVQAGVPAVQLAGLRRVFVRSDGSLQVAVEGLSLRMHAGRITALLGHNGAGKTTTIHMLTGMLQPSGGTAFIGGADIRTSMAAIRTSMGICPQFDILWPDLTVREHLVLYASIKGAPRAEAGQAAHTAAEEVGLADKLSCLAGELSGGQRRKLSVAIAFLGSPAVVFLDEPTSGMDPYSRRATWEIIRSRRSSCAIVLTTHSMEEADLLADDIHILAEGRLAASGTPLQLKTQYGVGYTLTVVLSRQPGATSQAAAADGLLALVTAAVPSAELLSAAGAEVAVRLPAEHSAAFPQLLRCLEASSEALGVESYGLSITTLEEVFLAVADNTVALRQPSSISTGSQGSSGSSPPALGASVQLKQQQQQPSAAGASHVQLPEPQVPRVMRTGVALYWQQYRALFTKRMLCAGRDRLAVMTQLLVPLLLVMLAMAVATLETSRADQPPLLVSRQRCLMGAPALLAAAPAVRQQVEFSGLLDAYPRPCIADTQYTQLYRGSDGPPLNLTLEGELLSRWDSGVPHFDALYVASLPTLEQLLSGGSAPAITLLVNQSAVSALPAALNQATTALLRVIVAAGGRSAGPRQPTACGACNRQWSADGGCSSNRDGSWAAGLAGEQAPSMPVCRLPCQPSIAVSSAPLPLVAGEAAQRLRQDAGALMLVLCMTLSVCVLSASFVVFLVREQENNSKHLQMVSGAPPTAFWLANFCWDCLNFALPAAGIVALVWWYNVPQLAGPRLVAMALLLGGTGPAGITCTYLCHFFFRDEMAALQRLNTSFFLTGYLGFTAVWVMDLISRIMAKQAVAHAAGRIKAVLRLASPHYCFAQGLYDITNTYKDAGSLPIPGPAAPSTPFCYEVLGVSLLHLLAQTLLFGGLAVALDVGLMQLLAPCTAWVRRRLGGWAHGGAAAPDYQGLPPSEGAAAPPDVLAEKAAVLAGNGTQDAMVVVDGITKTYSQGYGLPRVVAVEGLWLRVFPGECFGLLGVNGAGKTTTFKVMTGEVAPDTGDVLVAGHSVLKALACARQHLGYCPQFEALPAAMTGREVLHMYAALRGVATPREVRRMADELLAALGLADLADVACGVYSGGNKRKLSVCVALVGGPPLVLLDEPSTGMDPAARRFLWRVLQSEVLGRGRTIILTTHSMEEVDALASRLVIMAKGAARCCGTPQHLKSEFGDGYALELRLSPLLTGAAVGAGGDVEVARAEAHFLAAMPGAEVLEREAGRLLLRLPIATGSKKHAEPALSLAAVFEAVEAARAVLGISAYSISQSSLERVFLSLAQGAERDAIAS